MTETDIAETKIKTIYEDVKGNLKSIQSEEDSKIQIINRVFNEALSWSYTEFRAENKHENGFSDYILTNDGKPSLLVEAKRKGKISVSTSVKDKVRHLKISGSSLKKAIDGIDQAVSYASPNGLPVAVLTDGFVWIIFKTFIPGENFKSKE
ncbi:type I restriction endonuclease, partial [Winogradskyella sp.]